MSWAMSNSSARKWRPPRREIHSGDYRRLVSCSDLVQFSFQIEQTDLMISAKDDLTPQARELVQFYRKHVKDYIADHPKFLSALTPVPVVDNAPPIVTRMAEAAATAGVGPMAAVAGAIAESVGRGLLAYSSDIIVENGGDIFCSLSRPAVFLLLAEKSDFGAVRFTIETDCRSYGVCTSAGSTGPSMSFGIADAVMIAAEDTALADAIATAAGNIVQAATDVGNAVELARSLGAMAAIVVKGDQLGAFGSVKLEAGS